MEEISIETKQRALNDFDEACLFVISHHNNSLERLKNRQNLVENFEDYFEESVYCIIASGFRAEIAAGLVDDIVACGGDTEKMSRIFNNKNKLNAIKKTFEMRKNWPDLREKLLNCKNIDDVAALKLPFIGKIISHHLARNIGLFPQSSKPDLHMMRYVDAINWAPKNEIAVTNLCQFIAKNRDFNEGCVDFIFWIWLSHEKGKNSQKKCCIKNLILR